MLLCHSKFLIYYFLAFIVVSEINDFHMPQFYFIFEFHLGFCVLLYEQSLGFCFEILISLLRHDNLTSIVQTQEVDKDLLYGCHATVYNAVFGCPKHFEQKYVILKIVLHLVHIISFRVFSECINNLGNRPLTVYLLRYCSL